MSPFEQYSHTLDLLMSGHLLSAIRYQQQLASNLRNGHFMDELMQTEETYTMMLKYFADGVKDERRTDVYADILSRTLAMAEELKRAMGLRDSTTQYYSRLRTITRQARSIHYYSRRLQAVSGQQLFQNIIEGEDAVSANSRSVLLNELFDCIWVAGALSAEDYEILSGLFSGHILTDGEKQWMVSALTLSLLNYYHIGKLQLLVQLVDVQYNDDTSDEALIHCRALVGVALAAMYYRKRFAIQTPHHLFDFMPDVGSMFSMLQILFLVQSQTHRVRKTFDRDFMSLMSQMKDKMSPEELRNMLEDEDPDVAPDIDPEVIRRVQQQMQETSDMAYRGLDMMFPYFKQLKGYPFFNETRNWLKPLQVITPDFKDTLAKVAPLFAHSPLCDSDKYSMMATIASMPQTYGQMITSLVDELDEAEYSDQNLRQQERKKTLDTFTANYSNTLPTGIPISSLAYAAKYLQDLYRYFHISIENVQDGNPFAISPELLFLDSPFINHRVSQEDFEAVAKYAYRNKLYKQALVLTNPSLREGQKTSQLFCFHRAFCHAVLHQNQEAIEAFRCSEASNESIPQEMLAIYADCLLCEGQAKEAVRIFEKLYRHDTSDSPDIALYTYAVALSQIQRYAEAIDLLYKEDYLRPNQVKVVRLLAWCSLRNPQSDTPSAALSLYQRLLKMKPLRPTDWYNAGHAALAEGQVALAVQYYRQSGISAFTDDDKFLLTTLGVPSFTVRLMEDTLENLNNEQ